MVPSATGVVARQIVGNRDLESSAISGRHVLTQSHSFHHRQLRSQGGPDTPDNLVLVSGTGTTGEHGWIHSFTGYARVLGLIVPSHENPTDWPIYRRDPYGVAWDWFTQDLDGQLTWYPGDAVAAVAANLSIPPSSVRNALHAHHELVRRERAGR